MRFGGVSAEGAELQTEGGQAAKTLTAHDKDDLPATGSSPNEVIKLCDINLPRFAPRLRKV